MVDDVLLQEIQSLKEQLKIAVNIITQYAPEFETSDFMHSLQTEDYQLFLDENEKEDALVNETGNN